MRIPLREARLRRGLLQEELARAARISRQALSAIEAGRASPSTPVALRLASALGESVEDLFGQRRRSQARHLLSVGCDPALAILAGYAGELPGGARLRWANGSSGAALDALARGEAHIAGIHLRDEQGGGNSSIVRARAPGAQLAPFARWELGLAVLRGNPRRLRTAADLARPGVRLVNREPGSGARLLLDARLGRAGIAPASVVGYRRVARSHLSVAQAVVLGEADAGVATRAACRAWGLDFVPWSEERFDLVIPEALVADARVQRVLETLHGRPFRRRLAALEGYRLP
jgi:molybdate-binding protein/DNA-binding XRE family transcriptional regulator